MLALLKPNLLIFPVLTTIPIIRLFKNLSFFTSLDAIHPFARVTTTIARAPPNFDVRNLYFPTANWAVREQLHFPVQDCPLLAPFILLTALYSQMVFINS